MIIENESRPTTSHFSENKKIVLLENTEKKQYFSRAMDLVSLDIFEVFVEATH